MSAEITSRELVVVGILAANLLALVASLIWAWRGGYLTDLDDRNTNLHPEPSLEEVSHG